MLRSASIAALLSLSAAPLMAAPGNVVTDIPVVRSLVQQVMGDLGEAHVLLPDGASAHHYQMRPSDAQALQAADLLVWMGPELTPWLARAAQNLAGDSAKLQLLSVEGIYLQNYAAPHSNGDHDDHDDHAHDGGHEEEHDHSHGDDHNNADEPKHVHDDEHEYSHEGTDPHAWLDPANAGPWLGAISAALSENDPENAAIYKANAEATAARIAQLQAELTEQLAPFSDTRVVVFHDAYGYFTNRFGLQPTIPVALGDAAAPSAARIEAVRAEIAQSGATCAFAEFAHDPRLVETAIETTDVRLGATIDPQGGAAEPGPEQYQATLRNIADALTECL